MKRRTTTKTLSSEPQKVFLFGKKNYMFMLIGLVVIALGLLLMTGPDANTRPDGVFDKDYWNEGIFSFRRIRLAPLLIVIGFIIEIYAILVNPTTQKDN